MHGGRQVLLEDSGGKIGYDHSNDIGIGQDKVDMVGAREEDYVALYRFLDRNYPGRYIQEWTPFDHPQLVSFTAVRCRSVFEPLILLAFSLSLSLSLSHTHTHTHTHTHCCALGAKLCMMSGQSSSPVMHDACEDLGQNYLKADIIQSRALAGRR
eukprot:COSAG05_NODE_2462_length_3031_cov_10.605048_1_plen_155_part_00